MIIGNKSDLNAEREVPREVAEKFAAENNMKHFETSAKGSEYVRIILDLNQVDTAFREFASDILKNSLESGNKTLIREKKA